MKINLLPPELQPTRPSPIPYMPLFGLIAISVIWVITQLAVAAGARNVTGVYRGDLARVSKELGPTKEIPAKLERSEADGSALKLKAAAVTVLTHGSCALTPILRSLAETAPQSLRLTGVSLDLANGTATVVGYGGETNADVEVATFIRALNTNKLVTEAFDGATLNYCQNSKRGNIPAKEFSISLKFRDRFKSLNGTEQAAEMKENNGTKNRPKT